MSAAQNRFKSPRTPVGDGGCTTLMNLGAR